MNRNMEKFVERKIYMNKKRLFVITFVLLIAIVLIGFLSNTKSKKEKIFDYVMENESLIYSVIDKIDELPLRVSLNYGEEIVGVGNSKIDKYTDDVDGLYVEIKKSSTENRVEISDDVFAELLDGSPVTHIGIDNDIIIFDCGGKGIAPSSQDYMFYYSPSGKPYAVSVLAGGNIVCEPSQMEEDGEGYKYIDDGYNIFYTKEISDKLYFCEAQY